MWFKEQRTLALTRAYMLLKQPDGSVAREDWVHLMGCLRPDCNEDHVSIGDASFCFEAFVLRMVANAVRTRGTRVQSIVIFTCLVQGKDILAGENCH